MYILAANSMGSCQLKSRCSPPNDIMLHKASGTSMPPWGKRWIDQLLLFENNTSVMFAVILYIYLWCSKLTSPSRFLNAIRWLLWLWRFAIILRLWKTVCAQKIFMSFNCMNWIEHFVSGLLEGNIMLFKKQDFMHQTQKEEFFLSQWLNTR